MSYANVDNLVIDKPPSMARAWATLIIRVVLFMALIYGIFLEAGICTAFFALFILIGSEIRGHVIRKLVNDVFGIYGLLSVILSKPPMSDSELRDHHNWRNRTESDGDGVD